MALKSKNWVINPVLPADAAASFMAYPAIHPTVAQILYNRGFIDPDSAFAFLQGKGKFGDPFEMKGIDKAVGRIMRAIRAKEAIVVYGDFDADGVTSTALLTTALKSLGALVKPYIPHRVDEGYGLNNEALLKLAKEGANLVITVDCGIRSLDEVRVGREAGLDLIITDHHSVGAEVPAAFAVINPKQPGCKYPEKMLAGVGVTYKLAEALFKARTNGGKPLQFPIETLLDLVAIGTVADLVPLGNAENRRLVIEGLKQLRKTERPGLRSLMEVAQIVPDQLSAMTIGFGIGPRLNAAGRLDSAMSAFRLLATEDPAEALELAHKLQKLNEERQELTREMQAFARTLAGTTEENPSLIFAASENFKQGLVGLVAGRLTEEYYRPSIVVQQGKDESHGSCRSIAEFNITAALDSCADLLIRHGGHAQAAGFSIHNDNLETFHARMLELASIELEAQDLRPKLEIDAEVTLRQLDKTLHNGLAEMEPCGHGFPAPVLMTKHLRVVDCRAVGKDGAHLKLKLSDGFLEQDAIAFRFGEMIKDMPRSVDVAYQIDLNEWNGEQKLQMKVLDLRAADASYGN